MSSAADAFASKLADLTNTQQSIQSLSFWIVTKRRAIDDITRYGRKSSGASSVPSPQNDMKREIERDEDPIE